MSILIILLKLLRIRLYKIGRQILIMFRIKSLTLFVIFLFPVISLSFNAQSAVTYPTRPIRLIVPWTPGGPVDTLSRIVGQRLFEKWGQAVIVDNRPGAGAVIGTNLVAHATPDGYTLLMAASGPNSILPSLANKLPYDAIKDFERITLIATQCYVLYIFPSLQIESVKDLIVQAKLKPAQFTYSSSGNGSPSHLSGELFKFITGVNLQHIPYKGSVPAMLDVVAGRVNMSFGTIPPVLPNIKNSRVKALAVTSPVRVSLLPNIPTIAESGFPGFEALGWEGLLAPKGISSEITIKLSEEINRQLNVSKVKEFLLDQGFEIHGSTPQNFDKFYKDEIIKWSKVIKSSNIKLE